ncbi:MAG TPA: dienelactone hydrolase family protein, partial [Rariglobus sp.]
MSLPARHLHPLRIAGMLAALACILATPARAETPDKPVWDLAALSHPPKTYAAPTEVPVPDGMRTLCFEGPDWRGKPTRVFAYLGLPATATPDHKVPGIVLVHGAGGTAFSRWVKIWTDRGYAAIAFDDEGQLPLGKYNAWAPNPDGGPRRADIPQLGWPVTDQWMYHAVADTMLANSLLASQPQVDPSRIGVCGISWGGVIAANVAGLDPRFKFAAMIYGCGFIARESDDGSTFVGRHDTPEQRAAWTRLWDPGNHLPQSRMPLLWLAGATDFAFTPTARQQSSRAALGPQTISLRTSMPHAHSAVSEAAQIVEAFADNIVRNGPPLPRITDQKRAGNTLTARYTSPTSI